LVQARTGNPYSARFASVTTQRLKGDQHGPAHFFGVPSFASFVLYSFFKLISKSLVRIKIKFKKLPDQFKVKTFQNLKLV
jgi:hypothetical protein